MSVSRYAMLYCSAMPPGYDLQGLALELDSNSIWVRERLAASFSACPPATGAPVLFYQVEPVDTVPTPPDRAPDYAERDLIHYYLDPPRVVAHLPRYGQLQIDLARGEIRAAILPAAVTTYGVLEDLIAIGLSPLLRRHGRFLLHAFAAEREKRAVLLVGGIGAGKTTTGIALVRAGWRLLSNDSPLLDQETGEALSYPGLLSAYPETLRRFPELTHLIPSGSERRKITFAAESVYPGVWAGRAVPGAIVFPHVAIVAQHQVTRLAPAEALRALLPNAVERWDAEMIPAHLALLNRLVAQTPAFRLELGPVPESLPELIGPLLERD